LSETRKYRSWTVQQKLEIVLAGLRGDRSVAELCREHQISENLFYTWRDKLLKGGAELAGRRSAPSWRRLRKRVRDLEHTLGRKTYELEILGNGFRARECPSASSPPASSSPPAIAGGRGAHPARQPTGPLPGPAAAPTTRSRTAAARRRRRDRITRGTLSQLRCRRVLCPGAVRGATTCLCGIVERRGRSAA
jgi:transposase